MRPKTGQAAHWLAAAAMFSVLACSGGTVAAVDINDQGAGDRITERVELVRKQVFVFAEAARGEHLSMALAAARALAPGDFQRSSLTSTNQREFARSAGVLFFLAEDYRAAHQWLCVWFGQYAAAEDVRRLEHLKAPSAWGCLLASERHLRHGDGTPANKRDEDFLHGVALMDLGAMFQEERLHKLALQALDKSRELLPHDGWHYRKATLLLAYAYYKNNDLATTEPLLEESVLLWAQHHDGQNHQHAYSLLLLAYCKGKKARKAEALSLAAKALSIYQALYATDSKYVLASRRLIAHLSRSTGERGDPLR